MATKIRLQRHGRKGYAYYHIVVADSRAPRDGKFIEKLGTYNPNTNPATVDLNFEKALQWVLNGAEPTDTARTVLSGEGVYLKKHLLGGVKKGAFSEAVADQKFEAWKKDKDAKAEAKKASLKGEADSAKKAKLSAEQAFNKAKAEAVAKKKAEAIAAAEAANAPAAEAAETEAPAAE